VTRPILALAVVALFSAPKASIAGQEDVKRTLSVASRAHITVTTDWSQRSDIDPPPVTPLLSVSPEFGFSDFGVLENRGRPAILEIGVSGNPFIGKNSVEVDTLIHESLLSSLFSLFFPPPRNCLAMARSAFDEELHKNDEVESGSGDRSESRASSQPIHVNQECRFNLAPLDFYASQLSRIIILHGTRSPRHIEPTPHTFYLPPMEQVEIAGKTFFIFEARADHALQLREVQSLGLADDRQGARAYFFWAIGATTPFPFLRDAQRKDLQIVHVVYATLAFDGEAREEFRSMLNSVRFDE
jgi:hypothetical protein